MSKKVGSSSCVDSAQIDAIQTEVDKIDGVISDTEKIADVATLGLLETYNSLAYRVSEIERHLHGREKWFGVAASPSGETNIADRMSGTIQPFRLTAGNNAFGNWVQVLGSSDTPVKSGYSYFDAHRFMVTATNSTKAYIIQVVAGESADIAGNITNELYTAFPYIAATNNNDSGISEIMTSRVPAGTKVWARCACIGGNGTTIDFYFGIHEYEA